MHLNTIKRIKSTLVDGMLRAFVAREPKKRTSGVIDTHLFARTPEYKLNSGFRELKTHTFSCTIDNPCGGVI